MKNKTTVSQKGNSSFGIDNVKVAPLIPESINDLKTNVDIGTLKLLRFAKSSSRRFKHLPNDLRMRIDDVLYGDEESVGLSK